MFWKSALIATTIAMTSPLTSAPMDITVPSVPANLAAPAGVAPFLIGHATGTQNYACLPAEKRFAWTLLGPQATLVDDAGAQLTTHFLSPNPDERGTARATWQSSIDTSSVWAVAIANSTDPAYVAPGAIPWLLLRAVGSELGPQQGGALADTLYIQRVNTAGGVAPSGGCEKKEDVGTRVFVPYTTDYVFYR